jgi:hypothetical protein
VNQKVEITPNLDPKIPWPTFGLNCQANQGNTFEKKLDFNINFFHLTKSSKFLKLQCVLPWRLENFKILNFEE